MKKEEGAKRHRTTQSRKTVGTDRIKETRLEREGVIRRKKSQKVNDREKDFLSCLKTT